MSFWKKREPEPVKFIYERTLYLRFMNGYLQQFHRKTIEGGWITYPRGWTPPEESGNDDGYWEYIPMILDNRPSIWQTMKR